MRALRLIAALLLIAAASPAAGQTLGQGAPWAAPTASVQATPPAPRAAPLAGSGLQSTLRPQTNLRGITSGGFSGLAVAGDQAPICRSRCANDRYLCEAAADGSCDERWLQCTTACAPARRR